MGEFGTEAWKAVLSIQAIYPSQGDEIIEPSFVIVGLCIQGLTFIMWNVLLDQIAFVF